MQNLARKDDFQKQHRSAFLDMIAGFKAPATKSGTGNETSTDGSTIIGARVRPLLENEIADGEVASVVVRDGTQVVDVHELRQKFNNQPALNSSSFHLDKAYGPSDDSDALYGDLVQPLVKWSWSGGVSTLFAYGQTGSGKTYSVNEIERLAAGDLMNGIFEGEREIHICVFELIGNASYDLLNDHRQISVLEDSFGDTQLVGAVECKPGSAEELLSLIEKSMAFRKTAPTLKNDTSSRSHAVCRIRIVNKDMLGVPDGLLYVVDLAGSEMAADVKDHTAERMKETRDINTSLSILKDCIRGRALVDGMGNKKAKAHIPFRSSVITKVLKNVFDVKSERASMTAVLACVKPSFSAISATQNTLRYGELLRIPVSQTKAPAYNASIPRTWSNEMTREWIRNNSGTPAIDSRILAPVENGTQLCRLPKAEFVTRSLKTPGVTEERARVFYDKLWRLHIDSRGATTEDPESSGISQNKKEESSIPFKGRMRPGMYIRVKARGYADPGTLVVILCPEDAFAKEEKSEAKQEAYVCAAVSPGLMMDAFEVSIAHQRVVKLDDMLEEIMMEYDSATRYYYMSI
ncbi:diatom spindle kinesin 1 (kinesin motor domain containing protein) [Phlyctema vagabunda]|uniref:Diatom spindle kinesin 1 (Kinesin motor domain containing protein) n=1 Tax=Phlyctema vagabunda TaxID=108571 RepID=A0ABR4PG34_9HELO